MPFLFPEGESAAVIVDRLRQNRGWGEIVGPHGSGKSSLAASLREEIERTGCPTLLVELHDGQCRLPSEFWHNPKLVAPRVLIVDGYEQLNRWNRGRLKRLCRARDLGLLVTAHESVGMPPLFTTSPSPALAEQIVAQLLAGYDSLLDCDMIRERFTSHQGDLREMLFDLYDLYQQRQTPP